jgi:hypothetical protein
VLLIVAVIACFKLWHQGTSSGQPRQAAATAKPAASPAPVALGVYEPSGSWSSVASFGQQAGRPVRYVLAYLGDGDPFPVRLAEQAYASGASLVMQFRPGMSMAQVVAGADDAYLSSLLDQVREFGHPVILSFAPEANGDWYQYGWTNTPPAQYRAAWTHLMSLGAGVGNVTWMETLNINFKGSAPLSDYLVPGVGRYGLDGYYASPDQGAGAGTGAGDTFASVFGATLAELRQLTSTPVMIAETGIPQDYQSAGIPGLIQGAKDNHLAGVIWLDANIDGGHWAMTQDGFAALRP